MDYRYYLRVLGVRALSANNLVSIAEKFLTKEGLELNQFLLEEHVPLIVAIKTIRLLTGFDMRRAHEYIFQIQERRDELNREISEHASESRAWRRAFENSRAGRIASYEGGRFVFEPVTDIITIFPDDIDRENFDRWKDPMSLLRPN